MSFIINTKPHTNLNQNVYSLFTLWTEQLKSSKYVTSLKGWGENELYCSLTKTKEVHIDFKNTRSKLYKEFIKYLHDEGYENYLMGNSNDRTVSINFREIKQE